MRALQKCSVRHCTLVDIVVFCAQVTSPLPALSIAVCAAKAHRQALDRACRRDFSAIMHFATSLETLYQVVSQAQIDLVCYLPERYDREEIARFLSAMKQPVIVIAEHMDASLAALTVRLGAFSAVQPGEPLSNAIADFARDHRQSLHRPRWSGAERNVLGQFIARSSPMRATVERIRTVAASPSTTVLILGETGSGKEMVASTVHRLSARKDGPFIAIDCGAIPETLIESELFGHVRGAFSGAVGDRAGRFEMAEGGTLFLDEIGELPLQLQAKLLRVLEEREVWRVGATKSTKVDVRIIAATNRDLAQAVENQTFRRDLYFRLEVFIIEVPPLNARGVDILHIAEHFLERFSRDLGHPDLRLSSEASAALLAHQYTGNVRELRNIIERAVVTSVGNEIGPSELGLEAFAPMRREKRPGEVSQVSTSDESSTIALEWGPNALDRLVEQAYREAMRKAEGNRSLAARLLGVPRPTLMRALARYQVAGGDLHGRPKKPDARTKGS